MLRALPSVFPSWGRPTTGNHRFWEPELFWEEGKGALGQGWLFLARIWA